VVVHGRWRLARAPRGDPSQVLAVGGSREQVQALEIEPKRRWVCSRAPLEALAAAGRRGHEASEIPLRTLLGRGRQLANGRW